MTAHEGSFRDLRVLVPFVLITLVWGSTWIVIKDQLGGGDASAVPLTWSVAYRFAIACAAMFAYALATGASLRIGWKGHVLAATFGVPQFVLNFNFVYAAEHYVTSGLVAVVFALLMVPNSALAWLFLKDRVTGRFVAGSALACAGVALLFVQEIRASPVSAADAVTGIGLALLAVISASAANIMQASARLRARPIASMLAWGMFYAVIVNALFAFAWFGPPVVEDRPGYWIGLAYLGLFASAAAFTLYFGIVRAVGPGKAAYSSLIVPVIAMAISTVAEGYRWSLLALAGGVLALIGMLIALTASRLTDPPID
ncbi:DMT family transporter [Allosphingosinicella sp.]|uniref:DMT family transporter n=1 Tax=Allosphingosinicella sp. TaxID=2823234 RepID=UPI002F219DC3